MVPSSSRADDSPVALQTEPARYRHWHDVELRDAVRRLRFEHPAVCCVVLESARPDVFCAGANIATLASASHADKVNFCKYTNETRLELEDATRAGQTWLAALSGTASGGGYELALACERVLLVDDRKSAVSLPEVSLLAVLPGTGGLTRLVDKRRVRRDRADRFCTLEEGVRAPRALEWGLVDAIAPPRSFDGLVRAEVARQVDAAPAPPREPAVSLAPLAPEVSGRGFEHSMLSVAVDPERRCAELEIRAPRAESARGWQEAGLALARQLEDALLRLRFHHPEIGVWLLRTRGRAEDVHGLDAALAGEGWLARQVRSLLTRVLRQLDNSARSLFALVEPHSCFAGSFLELALAADQSFMRDARDEPCHLELGAANRGAHPMANGLTRLETRFYGDGAALERAQAAAGPLDAERALALGLVTSAPDDLDYDDEVRVAVEERSHFSPDALTGMEASLRFPGPETLETKIFGRLSAWQNWVFQRSNASGPAGALASFGQPGRPKFDWTRT
jgi:benzoyl-CoA-dihydrodiol lyase